jgi:hypothetical protein
MFHGDLIQELHITDVATKGFKTFLKRYGDKVTDPDLFVNFTAAKPGMDKRFYGQNPVPKEIPKDPMPHAAGPAFLMKSPDHSDPVGMYGYPLEYVVKHPFDIVYGSEGRTLRVVRRTESCNTLNLQRATEKDLQKVLDFLDISASASEFIQWWKENSTKAYRKPTPGHLIWHLIQHQHYFKGTSKYKGSLNWRHVPSGGYNGTAVVGNDEYVASVSLSPNGELKTAMVVKSAGKPLKTLYPQTVSHFDPTDKNYAFDVGTALSAQMKIMDDHFSKIASEGKVKPGLNSLGFVDTPRTSYEQRMVINKLGWDAIQDTASAEDKAVIYHGEPEQIVFVNKKGFEIEDEFVLRSDETERGIAINTLDHYSYRINEYARKIANQLGDKVIERTRTPEGIGTSNSLQAIYNILAHGSDSAALAAMNIETAAHEGLERFFAGQGSNSASKYYRTNKGWLHVIVVSGGGEARISYREKKDFNKAGIAYEYLTNAGLEQSVGFYSASKLEDVVKDQHGNESNLLTFGGKKVEVDPDTVGAASNKAGIIARATQYLKQKTHVGEDLSYAFEDCRNTDRMLKQLSGVLGLSDLEPSPKSIDDTIKNAMWVSRLMTYFADSDAGHRLRHYQGSEEDYYTRDMDDSEKEDLRSIMQKAAEANHWEFGEDEDKKLYASTNKWVSIASHKPVEVDEDMKKIFELCLRLFVIVPEKCYNFATKGMSISDSLEQMFVKVKEIRKNYPNFNLDQFKGATTPSAETEAGGSAGESLPTQSSTQGG